MSLSIWDYVRRRTCEAMLAGFHDALDFLERQDQALLINAASKNLRKRLHELAHNGGNGNGGNGGNGNGGNGNGGHGNGGHANGHGNGGQHGGAAAAAETPPTATSAGHPKPHPQHQPQPGIQHDAPQSGPSAAAPQQAAHEHRKVGRPRKEVHG